MGRRPMSEEDRKAARSIRNQRYYIRHHGELKTKRTVVAVEAIKNIHRQIHPQLQPVTAFLLNNAVPLSWTEVDFLQTLLVKITHECEESESDGETTQTDV